MDLKTTLDQTRSRVLRRVPLTEALIRRIEDLEAEVQENRRLNRRVAELTDLVTELLIPIARQDPARIDEMIARYRGTLSTGEPMKDHPSHL